MARTQLTANPSVLIGDDDGAVQFSFTDVEKISHSMELVDRLPDGTIVPRNLENYTFSVDIVEGANNAGEMPLERKTGALKQALEIIPASEYPDQVGVFGIYFNIPELIASYSPLPAIGVPIYAFISGSYSITQSGREEKKEFLRGKIQIVKSVQSLS